MASTGTPRALTYRVLKRGAEMGPLSPPRCCPLPDDSFICDVLCPIGPSPSVRQLCHLFVCINEELVAMFSFSANNENYSTIDVNIHAHNASNSFKHTYT